MHVVVQSRERTAGAAGGSQAMPGCDVFDGFTTLQLTQSVVKAPCGVAV